jgi:glycosyltransferase involved in cell wall biosynthesis
LADADSTDRTVKMARDFSCSLAINIIKGGLPSIGRNNGAYHARSRYLLFVDADVELADTSLLRRAVDLMQSKSLHCVTTDILCRDGRWLDRMMYHGSNFIQRLSRLHKPFATGMFMLLDRECFMNMGGFDEQALFAEDYQLTRQIDPKRFSVIKGGVYSTNRRFRKTGHFKMLGFFIKTAFCSGNTDYFRSREHQAYWEAY